jgi:hypothetical protein
MEFRQFLEEQEKIKKSELEEASLTSPLKFVAGAAANLGTQTARGFGNLASGAVKGAYGLAQTSLGGLQSAGGGWKTKGKESISRGLSNIGSGGVSALRGASQLAGAWSGVSPILRAAQAASEPVDIDGIYAPASKNRTFTQDLLGLNSWERPEKPKEKEGPKEEPKELVKSSSKKKKKKNSDDIKAKSFLAHLEKRDRLGPKPQPEIWKKLSAEYGNAKTLEEREEIKRKMRLVNPYLYQQAADAGLIK